MSRIVTIAVVVSIIFAVHVAQLAAIEVLGEARSQIIMDGDSTDLYDKRSIANHLYEVVVVWTPLIVDAGVILWAFAREYRRQRTTAVRGVRP